MKVTNPRTDGAQLSEPFDHDIFDRDELSGIRQVEVAGQQFTLIADRQHGFWRIKPKKGPTPAALESKYTTVDFATQAINKYMATKKK